MNQQTIRLAAILGALTVIIGAFGAHGLKPMLTEYQLGIFEKGVQYQFYHVLALGLTGLLQAQFPQRTSLKYAAYLFLGGILFFSGSLYLLACADIAPFPVRWAGPITPIGGVFFIAAWLMLLKKS
jgi:uncharacterized membrane protein YgdD (TMEM256/DUF423 family)